MAFASLDLAVEDVTDDELTALALAADPDVAVDDDAIPFWDLAIPATDSLLPYWYMPSPMSGARRLRGWRRRVVIALVLAFVLIDGVGLCSTYGFVGIA